MMSFSSLAAVNGGRRYARGRYALLDAYRMAGVSKYHALLLPAYHCRTMLDPAVRLDAEVGFYPIRADLTPDLDALSACIHACANPVKALLVTHYFGLPVDLNELARYCDSRGITLIEDCSHALFINPNDDQESNAPSVGQTGRYCIASPYKFYACEDGGLLWANHGASLPEQPTQLPSVKQELRGVLASLYRIRTNTSPAFGTLEADIKALEMSPPAKGNSSRTSGATVSTNYLPAQEGFSSLRWSHWIMHCTNISRLAQNRRNHYVEWVNAVAGLPHCRALLPCLPADCVPYMFPLVIDHPEFHFHLLKHLGLPIWRWDDMAVAGCAVSAHYRMHLLHLPCHQALTVMQMLWMTTVLSKVMRSSPPEHR